MGHTLSKGQGNITIQSKIGAGGEVRPKTNWKREL